MHRSELARYQCGTCEWFEMTANAGACSIGSCRYKAPDATGDIATSWPRVTLDDWCRHHAPRNENRYEDPEDE